MTLRTPALLLAAAFSFVPGALLAGDLPDGPRQGGCDCHQGRAAVAPVVERRPVVVMDDVVVRREPIYVVNQGPHYVAALVDRRIPRVHYPQTRLYPYMGRSAHGPAWREPLPRRHYGPRGPVLRVYGAFAPRDPMQRRNAQLRPDGRAHLKAELLGGPKGPNPR